MTTNSDVTVWLNDTVDALVDLEGAVRRDEHDAVHKARTMTRRLRTVLPLVPGPAAKEARKLLGKYGKALGAARDLEVRAELAEGLIDGLGERDDTDAARKRLVESARHEYGKAHDRVIAFLDRPAYRRMVKLLEEAAVDVASLDELAVMHEARKSARALRYLAEAYGDREKADIGARLQDELGDHRDHALLARSLEGEDDEVLARVRATAQARADGLVGKG